MWRLSALRLCDATAARVGRRDGRYLDAEKAKESNKAL